MDDFPPLSSAHSGHPAKQCSTTSASGPPPLRPKWCHVARQRTQADTASPTGQVQSTSSSSSPHGAIDPATGFERADAPGVAASQPHPVPAATSSQSAWHARSPDISLGGEGKTGRGSHVGCAPAPVPEMRHKQEDVASGYRSRPAGPDAKNSSPAAADGGPGVEGEKGLECSKSTTSEDSSSLLGSVMSSDAVTSAGSSRTSSASSRSSSPLYQYRSVVEVAPGVIIRERDPRYPRIEDAPLGPQGPIGGRTVQQNGRGWGHGQFNRGFNGGPGFNQEFRERGFPQQWGINWQEERIGGRFDNRPKHFPHEGHPPFNRGPGFNHHQVFRNDNNFNRWSNGSGFNQGFNSNRQLQPSASDSWSRHSKGSRSSHTSLSSQSSLPSASTVSNLEGAGTQPDLWGAASQLMSQHTCQWYGNNHHRLADVSEWLWAIPEQRNAAQQPTLVAVPVLVPGPDGEVQYIPWVPWDPTALIRAALQHQIEYYFSEQNLVKDEFLRSRMDAEGYVDVSVISKFNKVRCFLVDNSFILSAIELSDAVDVKGTGIRRRHGWELWLPAEKAVALSDTTGESDSQEGEGEVSEAESLCSPTGSREGLRMESCTFGHEAGAVDTAIVC